jgi:hypothetical protein
VATERDALAATGARSEAARTLPEDRSLRFITDGNPSYQAGVHFLNAHRTTSQPPFTLRHVMGLENGDESPRNFAPSSNGSNASIAPTNTRSAPRAAGCRLRIPNTQSRKRCDRRRANYSAGSRAIGALVE